MSSPRLPSVKLIIKFCSVAAAIAAILFATLGPADWQFRTGLGWKTEHVLAYFVVTLIVCLVWPRPFVVGPALMAASPLVEAPASFYTGSPCQFSGRIVRRRRGTGGGSAR